MKPAPGTITYRLHGVCPGRVVTLTQPLDAPASYRRDDEPMAKVATARRYPEIIAEIRAHYGVLSSPIGSVHITTTEQALAEAAANNLQPAVA